MSRPLLLLQREEYWIKTNPVWGIEANAVDGNYYHWNAKIHGLKGTSWEGGIFAIEIYFNEEYDSKPPVVLFSTIPFHPNIDMTTGKPCVDFLDNEELWEPGTTITGILQSLQLLLEEPVLDNAVNIFAAQAYLSSPHLYNQLVKDCVVASRKVEAGLSPYNEYFEEEENKEKVNKSKKDNDSETVVPTVNIKKIKKISFEDYYKEWMNSATIVPKLNESRFKRYSHHPEEYHVNRNKNNTILVDLPRELCESISKCCIEGVKMNEDDSRMNSPKKSDKKIEDPETLKKTLKPTSSNSKQKYPNKKSQIIETENDINEDLKDIKKHEITNTIEKETGQIAYVKRFFGKYKKPSLNKSQKKTDDIPEEISIKHHIDLNSFDNVYSALKSTKKIIKERYNCHDKPFVNVRDVDLYQYKFGHRFLNIIDQKEIESRLHIKLTDEEKEVLNKIVENEKYYNIFLKELKESQSRLKENDHDNINHDNNDHDNNDYDNNDHDNNDNDNNKVDDTTDQVNTEVMFPLNYDVIRIRPDSNDMPYDLDKIKEKSNNEVLPQTEENNTETNEDYLTEHEDHRIYEVDEHDMIKNQKYTDVIMNISSVKTPATPSIYNEDDYSVSMNDNHNYNDNDNDNNNYNEEESDNYNNDNNGNNNNDDDNKNDVNNDINNNNDNDSDNNNNNNNDVNNDDNNVLSDGEDPDGILEWCASLDHTKVDSIPLI